MDEEADEEESPLGDLPPTTPWSKVSGGEGNVNVNELNNASLVSEK